MLIVPNSLDIIKPSLLLHLVDERPVPLNFNREDDDLQVSMWSSSSGWNRYVNISLHLLLKANRITVLQAVSAQGVAGDYTDPGTGIIFRTQTIPNGSPNQGLSTGGYTVGLALPANAATVDSTEYIGMIVSCYARNPGKDQADYHKIGSSKDTTSTGWAGLSHGGGMTNNLLLMAWPYNGKILTSFRQASCVNSPRL